MTLFSGLHIHIYFCSDPDQSFSKMFESGLQNFTKNYGNLLKLFRSIVVIVTKIKYKKNKIKNKNKK
jgi:hypothetical protein